MITGMLGKKRGMTQIFTEDGDAVPVTVVEMGPCTVLRVKKNGGRAGRTAVQLGFDPKTRRHLPQSITRLYKKLSETVGREILPLRHIKEFLVLDEKTLPEVGHVFDATLFEAGTKVKVSGTSKGKGFQGVMKRFHYKGGRATHGSCFHRRPGSIGCRTWPAKVWKGKGLPGQMGGDRVTTLGLTIVRVDAERNLVYIRGAVPGANDGLVEIQKLTP